MFKVPVFCLYFLTIKFFTICFNTYVLFQSNTMQVAPPLIAITLLQIRLFVANSSVQSKCFNLYHCLSDHNKETNEEHL